MIAAGTGRRLMYDWPDAGGRAVAEVIAGTAGRETFTVQGMTGVDLSLPIAGPGSRSYAFLIDWHIRMVLALVWLFAGLLLAGSGLRLLRSQGNATFWLVIIPPLVIYLFYHPVVELLMRGQTPGKRMAGVRIVNRDGGPPGAGAILVRNAFRLLDSMPSFYVVGLTCTFITAQRVRIGDMAAGTLLVENREASASAVDRLASLDAASPVDPVALDLADRLLERWDQLAEDRRNAIAWTLLQRVDPQLARPAGGISGEALRERLRALGRQGGAQ